MFVSRYMSLLGRCKDSLMELGDFGFLFINMKQKPLATLPKWFCVCFLIYKNGLSCVIREFRIKVWSVPTK